MSKRILYRLNGIRLNSMKHKVFQDSMTFPLDSLWGQGALCRAIEGGWKVPVSGKSVKGIVSSDLSLTVTADQLTAEDGRGARGAEDGGVAAV